MAAPSEPPVASIGSSTKHWRSLRSSGRRSAYVEGSSVELIVGQALDITTGDLPEDSYSAEIADSSIVTFEKGGVRDGATFNPGLMAEKVGETEVTLTNEQGGIQPVEFTVTVVEKK